MAGMNTLRTKLTALLVAAIVLMTVAVTALSLLLLSQPHFETVDDANAALVGLVADLAAGLPEGSEVPGIQSGPAGGELAEMPTDGINAALARQGRTERVEVTHAADRPWPTLSMKLGDGRWLVVPLALPEPPDRGWGLVGWIVLLTLGTTAVMIFAVRRLTAPLALLERAAEAIGPGGELAPLPEEGPTEVRAAARAVNTLSSRLKTAMESRIRLVAAAGHDLRTPMTRMRLRAEFLEEAEREALIADLDELDRIADSAIRLVREEVESPGRTPLRLDLLVGEVVQELRGIGMAVELVAATPVTVQGRPFALKRAIRNLAINAATHGRAGRLRVAAEADQAVLVIEDSGPGIPDALLGQVFEPFFRVDPARGTQFPGAGLGLAIAREIIVNHGGELTLRNMPGGGLEQRVRLAAMPEAEGGPEGSAIGTGAAGPGAGTRG